MRLLVITHTFPPSVHSNAKRPYYLVKGFLEAGWEVTVVTTHLWMSKFAEEVLEHPKLTIDRRKDWLLDPLDGLRKYGKLGKWASKMAYGLVWPDFFRRWAKKIFRDAELIESHDRVLAFVFPASVLFAGEKDGVVDGKWTFDFQESVTPQWEKYPRGSPIARRLTPRLTQIEKRTLSQAGQVVFTADTNRQEYLKRGMIREEKARHIPYFYDTDSFRSLAPLREGFEICYFGGFDLLGFRSPEIFLRGLAKFLEKTPEARQECRFVFRGPWWDVHNEVIDELGLWDVCDIAPSVGYEEYIQLVRSSLVLLLVAAEEHNFFMPSKIVDYYGAQRPVLSFVPVGSEMAGVLDDGGMKDFCCDVAGVEEAVVAIQKLWQLYQSGELANPYGNGAHWSREVQMPRYLEAVSELVGDPLR